MKAFLISILLLVSLTSHTQDSKLKWWNPVEHEFPVIEGQAWGGEVKGDYDRLPARAESQVREVVYSLATNSAGLMIRFRTNATSIKVKYQVNDKENFAFTHMSATGVSGLDLYVINSDGQELWSAGKRSFGDTITYHFVGLSSNDKYHNLGNEYRLYLPLYNSVEWLEIGVKEDSNFDPLPIRKEKPIVVYGTSIAQGACASRPGMAWTAILGREMDRPLINLGFSGNGILELPIIDMISEIDAKVFVLDCLPNLIGLDVSDSELKTIIVKAVKRLRSKRVKEPILLVDHGGYTEGLASPKRKASYERVNRVQAEAFSDLMKEGIDGLFYLSHEELNIQLDDMVDGVHPTDLGMVHYAESYEAKLRNILQEPVSSTSSTTQPVIQCREPGNYNWEERHREILDLNKSNPPKTIIFANSIVHFWGGQPKSKIARDKESWDKILTPAGVRNYAYGWDRIENVLWRVYHGELDGFDAEKIMVMIGTNNLHLNTDAEIKEGLELLVAAIKTRQPKSEIVLMGLLPRRGYEPRIKLLNQGLASIASNQQVSFADLGHVFLQKDDMVNESLFSDGLHPNHAGYKELIKVLEPLVK